MILKSFKMLLEPVASIWLYVLKITLVIELPLYLLMGILFAAQAVGWYQPSLSCLPNSGASLAELVLLGAILESFLLAGFASLLALWVSNPLLISGISGLAWGALHALDFGLTFLCPAWSFFIMTMAFLAWRRKSFWLGYLAAVIPHLFHNIQAKIVLMLC